VGGWTTDQIAALKTQQVAAIETADLAGLTTAQVVAMSATQLASFTTAQIKALSSTQVQAISIAKFSSSQIGTMTSADLAELSSTQITSLTSTQLNSLTSSQVLGWASLVSGGSTQLDTLLSQQIWALTPVQSNQTARWSFQTPIVLDLDGNGIQTVNVKNGVTFDIDNDGKVERTGWVARGDGLLVRDLNGDGTINNGGELFGSGTVLRNGTKAKDGYEAMRDLDTNLDGILNTNDAAFSQLAVWADSNGNGVTDAGEMKRLSDLGITSLSLTSTASAEVNNGNLIGLMGSYTTSDGTTHTMGDVWFQTDSTGSKVFDLAAVAQAAGGPKINLANAQAETLKVTLADVLAVGEADILHGTSSVTINGDASDTVQLSGTWSYAGTQQDGADTYMIYVNQNAHLLVNDKIHTIIG